MRRWWILIAVLLLLVGGITGLVVAKRANDRAVRAEINGYYAELSRAIRERDLDAVTRYYRTRMLPTWKARFPDGSTWTLDQQIASIRKGVPKGQKLIDYRLTAERASVLGNVASVSYRLRQVNLWKNPKGKLQRLIYESSAVSFWVRSEEGWKTSRTVVRSNERSVRPALPGDSL